MTRIFVASATGAAELSNPRAVLVHVHALPALTLGDYCDACPSPVQALVRVRLKESGLALDLCGHHHREHEPALAPLVDATRHLEEIPR